MIKFQESFLLQQNSDIYNIYKQCIKKNIPLMRTQTIDNLYRLVSSIRECEILEIGTAFGFSSFYISLNKNCKQITTIEKNIDNFQIAKSNLANAKNIKLVHKDCFNLTTNKMFDLIILDGPKANQIELFEKLSKNLKHNGYFFIDNINLKKFENNLIKLTKNQIRLIKKVKNFKNYLLNLDKSKWKVKINDIEDGFAIVKKI